MAMIYEDALKSQIKSGALAPVYIILGEDDYLKRMYVNKISSLITDKDDIFNYSRFGADSSDSRYGIVVSAENAFSFNASYYTQEELEKKTHNYELTESDSVVFCVDYALNGIGSNSCGPVVLDQYRFDDVLFRFQFTLVPYVKG